MDSSSSSALPLDFRRDSLHSVLPPTQTDFFFKIQKTARKLWPDSGVTSVIEQLQHDPKTDIKVLSE
jgi:hypothetical protein